MTTTRMSNRQSGFAIAIVLLVGAVALAAAVGASLVASLSARQVASLERRSTVALLAAESGLNTIVARSNTDEYDYSHASVDAWLTATGLDVYELPDGSEIHLAALNETADRVTIRSEGVAPDGSTRVVFQDFALAEGEGGWLNPNDAALITIPPLQTNSKHSLIIGRDSEESSWIFATYPAREALAGEYVEYGGMRYHVDSVADDGTTVELTAVDGSGTVVVDGSTGVALIPYALTADHVANETTLGVTDPTRYPVGTEILVGAGRGQVTGQTETTIEVDWTELPGDTLTEGTPVRKEVPSALAQTGGCPKDSGGKLDEKLPQGCFDPDLGDLWASTFPGYTKSELRDLAADTMDDLPSQVFTPTTSPSWPTAPVHGLTWIDGASTGDANSNGLCGDGVVILNTGPALEGEPGEININVSDDCEFKGVLYVLGQLGLQGNLSAFSGTIIVEGPGQFTKVQGTGDKALYDPIAVRNAMNLLGPFGESDGLLAAIPSTWRLGQ